MTRRGSPPSAQSWRDGADDPFVLSHRETRSNLRVNEHHSTSRYDGLAAPQLVLELLLAHGATVAVSPEDASLDDSLISVSTSTGYARRESASSAAMMSPDSKSWESRTC
jgi:hypothetical protein